MAKKKFKTESQKLLDMMINSIYTHKEIFLRELISNASDAIDKLYYRSLTDSSVTLTRDDYAITLTVDKAARTITVSDNGCGMSREDLENNLGTIAKSGSLDFKKENADDNIDIIGQFGVGFYSAFMIADKITVDSRVYGAEEAYRWESEGVDGYSVEPCEKADFGTAIVMHVKANTEEEKYDDYLEEYKIRELIRKYSDYIRYPIKMEVSREKLKEGTEDEYETVSEVETLNSMTPLWKKSPSEITEEEYNTFYREKFYDYEAPVKTVHAKTEGTATFTSLLFIPSHAPFDYYTKEYEKGLQLYSSGVMIMEKCADLLPDYFGFVRGLVDSSDLTLNISRETLQHDHQLKLIAKTVEKKIRAELAKLLEENREKYETFFKAFGTQLKYGLYADYGTHKDTLKDLVLFTSSYEKKPVTLKEYVMRMKEEQKAIYYASGESVDKLEMIPQVEAVKEKGFEVLYLTDDVDEFAIRMLATYEEKPFTNVCDEKLDIATDEEKEAIKKENESAEEMLKAMKEVLGESVSAVRLTNTLKNHPVCLSSEGALSIEMEKVLNKMPGGEEKAKAEIILEINANHPIAQKLKDFFADDKEKFEKVTKVLYASARLIGGLSVENPSEMTGILCDLIL